MKRQFLTKQQRDDLLNEIVQEKPGARHELVATFAPYIRSEALKNARRLGVAPEHYEDIIAECMLTAYQEVQRFKPELSLSFSTFIKFHLRTTVEKYAGRTLYSLSFSDAVLNVSRRVMAASARLEAIRVDQKPLPDIVAAASRTSAGMAIFFGQSNNLPKRAIDINQPIGRGDDAGTQTLADTIVSPDTPAIDTIHINQVKTILAHALQMLDWKERQVVLVCVTGNDGEGATLETMARELRVSKERVRQIKQQALQKMKQFLEKLHLSYEELSAG